MSGPGDWPGDETAETRVLALPAPERQILAALAVVGDASLSADELAELPDVDDVIPLVEELERRGLIRRERGRYSVLGGIGEQIRSTDAALATGDRLLTNFTTLARRGALTRQRLGDDAQAILGLTEWAAHSGRWVALLELVQTLQASYGVAERAHEWRTLLEHALVAARRLGDRQGEIWALQQLATASAAMGDGQTAQNYLREADALQRGPQPTVRQEVTTEQVAPAGGGVPSAVFWIAGIVLALAAGVGLGYVLDSGGSNAGATTAPLSVTLTGRGTTVTTQQTVTLPATTLTTTSLATTTELVTTTTVVTTTPVAP